MTAIEDVMRAVLDARAKVYVTAREYPADRTMGDVLDLLDRARATVEDDPGYLRDRADRALFIRSGKLIEVRDLEEMRETDGVSMADRYREIFGHGEVQA